MIAVLDRSVTIGEMRLRLSRKEGGQCSEATRLPLRQAVSDSQGAKCYRARLRVGSMLCCVLQA